jgi:hypothetical protein
MLRRMEIHTVLPSRVKRLCTPSSAKVKNACSNILMAITFAVEMSTHEKLATAQGDLQPRQLTTEVLLLGRTTSQDPEQGQWPATTPLFFLGTGLFGGEGSCLAAARHFPRSHISDTGKMFRGSIYLEGLFGGKLCRWLDGWTGGSVILCPGKK